jgi:hypothetical protein
MRFGGRMILSFICRLGVHIAENPLRWMLGCFMIILICISGLYRFRQEKNPMKLWVPPDSDFVYDTKWLLSHYEEAVRTEMFILTGDNILEKQTLIKVILECNGCSKSSQDPWSLLIKRNKVYHWFINNYIIRSFSLFATVKWNN